jgi:hypothetical protein
MGMRRFASIIGALAWMFNGYLMVWFEFEQFSMAAWTLPASLLLIERMARRVTKASFIAFGVISSLMVTGTHIHTALYQVLLIAAYTVYRIKRDGGWRRRTLRTIAAIAAACIVGIVLSATTIMTSLHTLSESQRTPLSFDALFEQTGKLYPHFLVTAIFPEAFGTPTQNPCYVPKKEHQGYNNYNESCVYAGMMPLLLALTGILAWRREKKMLFFIIGAIMTLAMAMGSGLYFPLTLVPGLNISTPTRILYITHFCVAMTGAMALNAILERKTTWHFPCASAILTAVIAALLFALNSDHGLRLLMPDSLLGDDAFRSHIGARLSLHPMILLKPCLIFATCCFMVIGLRKSQGDTRSHRLLQALGIFLLLLDLFGFGWNYNTRSPRSLMFPETPAISFLRTDTTCYRIAASKRFGENLLSPFSIDNIGGYASLYPRRFGAFFYTFQNHDPADLETNSSRWLFPVFFNPPLFDVLNVKYVLLAPDDRLDHPAVAHIYNGECGIFENRTAFPRAFFVGGGISCVSEKEALDRVSKFTSEDFKRTVVLEEPLDGESERCAAAAQDSLIGAKLLRKTPNDRLYSVTCPEAGFLVISENYDRGWTCSVDGKRQRVLRGNYFMQTVALNPGNHTVSLSYRPVDILLGYGVSLAGWIILSLFGAAIVVARLRKSLHDRRATSVRAPPFL